MKGNKQTQMNELAIKEAKRINKQIKAEEKFDRDLKTCMRCKYFYGNNVQCIKRKCVKEEKKNIQEEQINDYCKDCPYKQEGSYCFPCMSMTFPPYIRHIYSVTTKVVVIRLCRI